MKTSLSVRLLKNNILGQVYRALNSEIFLITNKNWVEFFFLAP